VLNLASNKLGEIVLPEGWSYYDKYQPGNYYDTYMHTDGREQKENPGKPEGIIAIAKAIPDMGALTRLDISKNRFFHDDGGPAGKALGDMLAVNSSLQELDVSGNGHSPFSKGGPSFARALSVGISDNRAISTVVVNTFPLPIQDIKSKAELDFSGKELEVEDAIVIAALIPSNVSRIVFPHPFYH
jgi:hypothetical protein